MLRGVLFDVVVAIAILFLIVELVALVIGISLARRITRAVNQLYEGTGRLSSATSVIEFLYALATNLVTCRSHSIR